MRTQISRDERRWLEDHAARLRRMTAALDDDLDQVEQVEWSLFWQDMRRLYTRTSIHLETALKTCDRQCLAQGLEQIHNYSPDALVISLGVDSYEKDPISQFKLKSEHFLEIGSKIAQKIHCPGIFIMEGGYAVDEIGINVVNLLSGFLNE